MGIKNIRWIAIQTTEYQTKFTDWMSNKDWKATKNELDLFFSENQGEAY